MALKDAEPDRLTRCLEYPDPPGVQWNAGEVKSFCHFQFDPILTLSQIKTLLDSKGSSSLESYFEGLRREQNNPNTSWKLDEAFRRTFLCACKDARDVADAWLSHSPDSLWANVASGLQYSAAAGEARGTDYVQDTGPERMARMTALDIKAAAVLARVLKTHPDVTPAIDTMIWVDSREGHAQQARDRLAAALRDHPGSLSLHQTAATMYQGKWLGSDAEVASEKLLAQQDAAKNPLLIMVVSQIDWRARSCYGDCTWAKSDIDSMNQIGPSLPVLRQLVRLHTSAGDYAAVAIDASEILRLSSTSEVAIRTQRGLARLHMQDLDGAEADGEAALAFKAGYDPALTLLRLVSLHRAALAHGS
jgi:hypothetical protein